MKRDIVRRLLEFYLPATLSRGPPSDALVLPDLMFQRRSKDSGSNTFHTIRFVQVCVYPVKIFIVRLQIRVLSLVLVFQMGYPLLETLQRPRKCFTLQSRLSRKLWIDLRNNTVNVLDLRDDEQFCLVCAGVGAIFLGAQTLLLL